MNSNDSFTALACDVGGTNTTFALISGTPGSFHIVARHREPTQKVANFDEALTAALAAFRHHAPGTEAMAACISAAGPVENGVVRLTNARWDLHQRAVSARLAVPVTLINDLEAVCYGVPLIRRDDPEQFQPLAHPGEKQDLRPHGSIRAVVAAGTGLGVGYLSGDRADLRVFASEGGHGDIGDFDGETVRFRAFLRNHYRGMPDAEVFVSGQGIANAARFVESEGGFATGRIGDSVRGASDEDRPQLISRHAAEDRDCRRAMQLFIRMYGKFAGNVALTFLPYAGLYLAGGIAGKNLQHFLADDAFMNAFRTHWNPGMQTPLSRVPVGIILDYDISLYGCANCAWLMREREERSQ